MRKQQVRNLDVVHWQGLEDSLQALLLLQHLCLAARQHVRMLQHLYVAARQSPAWQLNSLSCCMQLSAHAARKTSSTSRPCQALCLAARQVLLLRQHFCPAATPRFVCAACCAWCLSESMPHAWPDTSLHQHLSVQ